MATPEQEIIWLAGLLEGEGCFYMDRQLSRSGSGEYTRCPKISVGMIDQDVIAHAARLFGTKVHAAKPYREDKRIYTASAYGLKAVWLMRAVLPWMGARRSEKISEVLKAHQDYIKNYPGAHKNRKVRPWSIDDSGLEVFGIEPVW